MLEAAKGWIFHVLQLGIAIAPFFAAHFSNPSIALPPLGNISMYEAPIATSIIALFSLAPRSINTKKSAQKWLFRAIMGIVLCFLLDAVLIGRYVVTVDTPHNGRITRSVGFTVQPSIRFLYPTENNTELLMIGGTEEWQIEKVWTPGSVLALRLCILFSFTLTLSLANAALGVAARDVRKVAGRKSKKVPSLH